MTCKEIYTARQNSIFNIKIINDKENSKNNWKYSMYKKSLELKYHEFSTYKNIVPQCCTNFNKKIDIK